MQSIRAWLNAHPDRAAAMMDANPSYVFFEEVDGLSAAEGPRGALGAPLTPGRSVAVDQRYVPLARRSGWRAATRSTGRRCGG